LDKNISVKLCQYRSTDYWADDTFEVTLGFRTHTKMNFTCSYIGIFIAILKCYDNPL